MKIAICQQWEESERGWGVRPDGFSLHLSTQDAKQYINDYWESMPDEIPDEYSRPSGKPYKCEIDNETHKKLKELRHIRKSRNTYPKPLHSTHCLSWKTMGD